MKEIKKPLILLLLVAATTAAGAQEFQVVYKGSRGNDSIIAVPAEEAVNFSPARLEIKRIIAATGELDVFIKGNKSNSKFIASNSGSFEFSLQTRAKGGDKVEVKDRGGQVLLGFVYPSVRQMTGRTPAAQLKPALLTPHEQAFENSYGGFYSITDYGIMLDNRMAGREDIGGPDFSHIFMDEFGNSIKTTMPQGLADQLYVVHIIFMVKKDEPLAGIFSIRQTKGRFNPALRAEGPSAGEEGVLQSTEDFDTYEKIYILSKSTEDIEFDLMHTAADGEKTKIESFKIAMAPSYHWSLHSGLLNSWLANPGFQLLEDPLNGSSRVVKRSQGKNRGVVTIAATLYTSPFTLIRYGIQKRKLNRGKSVTELKNPVPKSQKWSKSYLYERSLLDRFYPTIGVGLRDKVFDNLFGGFNIEFARGGYLFAGIHYGRVNVFDSPANFEFGKTPVSEAEFNLRLDEEWKVNFAVGVNIDFTIFSKFFK